MYTHTNTHTHTYKYIYTYLYAQCMSTIPFICTYVYYIHKHLSFAAPGICVVVN